MLYRKGTKENPYTRHIELTEVIDRDKHQTLYITTIAWRRTSDETKNSINARRIRVEVVE